MRELQYAQLKSKRHDSSVRRCRNSPKIDEGGGRLVGRLETAQPDGRIEIGSTWLVGGVVIVPVGDDAWVGRGHGRRCIRGPVRGLAAGLAAGLVVRLVGGPERRLAAGLATGLVRGLVGGPVRRLMGG